jgi:hypothetical protein
MKPLETASKRPPNCQKKLVLTQIRKIDHDSDPKHLKIVSVESVESDHDSEILRIRLKLKTPLLVKGAVDEAADEAAAGARRCWLFRSFFSQALGRRWWR